MPFLSPDWRFPGERWLRSGESGCMWENAKFYRQRMFEKINEAAVNRSFRQSLIEVDSDSAKTYVNNLLEVILYQPHIYLKAGTTREVIETTTISEAFLGLDMKAAIRDIRRFNYIYKIIYILISEYFHKLSGRLQLFIMELLRTMRLQVQASCNQTALMSKIVEMLSETLDAHKHSHQGSSVLWQSHVKAVDDLRQKIREFDIEQRIQEISRNPAKRPSLHDHDAPHLERLPTECLSRILSFVSNPEDLEMASRASGRLATMVDEEYLWRTLTLAHFTMHHVSAVNFGREGWSGGGVGSREDPLTPTTQRQCNWKRTYQRLLKRYGDRHLYSTKLALCEHCCCVFWPLFGHTCYYPQNEERVRLLSPEEFIALFPI